MISGRFKIIRKLGTGSSGTVYLCQHLELQGHLVAVKVLSPEFANNSAAAARFRNEIAATYGVSHPNVVRMYEYFRDGDLVAYTMEYVEGQDLADLINGDSSITIEEAVRILSEICSGVQAIHDAGMLHRDLKPENILLDKNRTVKITDFGVARLEGDTKSSGHGGVVGTIDYVSPEYLELGQVDNRSDIYAIGVLGYEMITGKSPFKANPVIETMTMRLQVDPKAPQTIRSQCPIPLSDIILKALARNPDERYQTAAEMFNDLTAVSLFSH